MLLYHENHTDKINNFEMIDREENDGISGLSGQSPENGRTSDTLVTS